MVIRRFMKVWRIIDWFLLRFERDNYSRASVLSVVYRRNSDSLETVDTHQKCLFFLPQSLSFAYFFSFFLPFESRKILCVLSCVRHTTTITRGSIWLRKRKKEKRNIVNVWATLKAQAERLDSFWWLYVAFVSFSKQTNHRQEMSIRRWSRRQDEKDLVASKLTSKTKQILIPLHTSSIL